MDFYFTDVFDSVYYALMPIGCFLWFIYLYLKENYKKIGLVAHIVIAISMGLRFLLWQIPVCLAMRSPHIPFSFSECLRE